MTLSLQFSESGENNGVDSPESNGVPGAGCLSLVHALCGDAYLNRTRPTSLGA